MSSPPAAPATSSSSAGAAQAVAEASTYRSLVWSGSVTLQLSLATDDVPARPESAVNQVYIQAPRVAYLPLILPEVRRQLFALTLDSTAASAISDDDIWLSHNSAPLRWHWPIGLLVDYHMAHGLKDPFASSGTAHVPFRVTVHLRNPPMDSLLMGPSLDSCRSCFMNQLKEAEYMRWGSVKRITNLKKEQQDGLWEALTSQDFGKFWAVASKLVPAPSELNAQAGGLPHANAVRSVPIRVYLPDGAPVLQDLAPPLSSEGAPVTLQAHLEQLAPLLYPSLATAVVQGIEVPFETELGWLGACLAGPDGWVAVVVMLKRARRSVARRAISSPAQWPHSIASLVSPDTIRPVAKVDSSQ